MNIEDYKLTYQIVTIPGQMPSGRVMSGIVWHKETIDLDEIINIVANYDFKNNRLVLQCSKHEKKIALVFCQNKNNDFIFLIFKKLIDSVLAFNI